MIHVYIIAVLGGIGYYLTSEESNRIKFRNSNKNKRKIFREDSEPVNDMANGDSIYSQDYSKYVNNVVRRASNKNMKKAHQFIENNDEDEIVILPQHQRVKKPLDIIDDDLIDNPLEPRSKEWTSISGEKMNKEKICAQQYGSFSFW